MPPFLDTVKIQAECCNAGSREKLVQTTVALMASKGYDGTGINEILETAGVTKSNFYYHFKSKEELCLAALDTIVERYTENVVHGFFLNRDLTPKARFEAFFSMVKNRMENVQCCQGCPLINLATETSDFHPAFREKIDAIFVKTIKAIETCLKEGIEAGEFRKDLDPKSTAQFIHTLMNGTILQIKTSKSPDILAQNQKTLFQLIGTGP